MTLEDFIDELARVIHDSESARMLVLRARFPAADLPAFDIPRVFWSRVIRAASDGKLVGGVRVLVDEAAKQYPGNTIFAGYRAQAWALTQGGAQDLLERLARHFDPNLTPPGSDVGPIAALVPHAVPHASMQAFFDSLEARFTSTLGTWKTVNKDALAQIHAALLQAEGSVVAQESMTWQLGHPDIFVGVLRHWPSHVLALQGRPMDVRNLWRTQAFVGGHQDLPIIAALLRNNLIPQAEVAEAVERTVAKLNGDIPTPLDEPVLAYFGFWNAFHKHAMIDRQIDRFDWGNRNAGLIAWRVQTAPIDPDTAKTICQVFERDPYPFTVRDALKGMLAANPTKMAELHVAAARESMAVPPALQ